MRTIVYMEVVDVVEAGVDIFEELLVVIDKEYDKLTGGRVVATARRHNLGRQLLVVDDGQSQLAFGIQLVTSVNVLFGPFLRMLQR